MKFRLHVFLLTSLLFACASNEKDVENKSDTVKIDSTEQIEYSVSEVDESREKDTVKTNNELGTEYTAKYICPNHCKGSGGNKPETCPVCGMDYMENPNSKP